MNTTQNTRVSRFSRRTSSALRSGIGACLALVALAAPAPLAAQTVYSLAPPPYQTVLSNTGAIVANACVWTYSAGTTTPIATYSDALGTMNANPIRADTAGRFTAYLLPGVGYKFTYEVPCVPPAHGALLRTADNVVGTPAAASVSTGTWIPSLGGTATYTAQQGWYVRVGALVMAAATLTVNTIGTGTPNLIAGLPFVVAGGPTSGSVGYFAAGAVAAVTLGGYANLGTTSVTVTGLAAAANSVVNGYSIFGNGTTVNFTMTYMTSAP